jgi:PAS domain S-box-containing protein
MTGKVHWPRDPAGLRELAESRAQNDSAHLPEEIEALSPEERRRIIHELRVHQIELEMQNEELRRAHTELETAWARYFDLYNLAPVGYCTLSELGIILEANLAAATLLGVGRSRLVNLPLTRFILREDQDIYYLHRKRLSETDEPQSFELRMVTPDGIEFHAHLDATAALVDDTPGYRVVIGNITERKRFEEALERARADAERERLRLETVMAVLPTGVAITDADGGTVQFNKEYERIWAGPRPATCTTEDYAAFKAWWADTGKPVAPEEWASSQALRKGKSVVGQMLEIQRFDGTRTFVINSAAPARDADGKIIGCAVAIQDISDLRKADLLIQALNGELQEHVANLEEMNKELESYSHWVTHDLRTPLRFVNKIAHELLNEPGVLLSDGASQQVRMIVQATNETAKLIENLLLFSQAKHEPLSNRRVNLRRLFQEVVKERQNAPEDRSVEIVIQDLPPCHGNRTLLKDVMMNLLDNAIKFTRRREKPRITIGCTETNAAIVYFVQDNGAGFNMKDSGSLFVPFRRLHRSGDFEGTGIGLALAKRIIERHGGRIWAKGEVDKGATFYFTLSKVKEE